MPIERFVHKGFTIWCDEILGCDVTLARKHGSHTFEIWVDGRNIGHRRSVKSASKLALTWAKSHLVIAILCLLAVSAQADNLTITIDTRSPGLRIFKAGDALVDHSTSSRPSQDQPRFSLFGPRCHYPWKIGITATCFWAGESAASGGGVSNCRSSYDPEWAVHAPAQNSFYAALPVVDIRDGHTVPEARRIPWFASEWVRDGQSILKDRWVAVRCGGRVAYCQLEDCGPFHTDSWDYCFGNDRPSTNRNNDAGIDVSPAVRDYLGLSGMSTVDWRWCDAREVPRSGPWAMFGANNTLAWKR